MRRRSRITIRPNRRMITMSRIFAGVFAAVGIGFAVVGFTTVIPSGAGVFGVVWTVIALGFAALGLYGACNKKGLYFGYTWEIEEEAGEDAAPTHPPAGATPAQSLKQLQQLLEQGLITQAEYEEKRREILKEL